MFSSYNDFHHNIYKDAMIVTSIDTFTSLLAGFTIFGILGNLAYNVGETDVSKVIKGGGSSLAFVSYPEAISKMAVFPQLFAVLFFFMLFVLGTGSCVANTSSIITNIMDNLPKGKFKHWHITAVVSLFGFLVGLVYVTPVIISLRIKFLKLLLIFFCSISGRPVDFDSGGFLRCKLYCVCLGCSTDDRSHLALWTGKFLLGR